MIKAIIFDFGQTLANSADGFRAAEKQAQAKLFADLALTIQEDFLSLYRRLRKELHEQSNFSRQFLFREVYYYYCRTPDEQMLEHWETEYWETVKAHTSLFPETLQVLQCLDEDYQLALITNTQGQRNTGTHRISLYPELEKYFAAIVVAGEDGIPTKPDPDPFHRCLEQLGVAPNEAVYVGDDWRIDVCGSEKAGLHPIWLKHHSVQRNWPVIRTSVPVITDLGQLLDLKSVLSI